jgi:hypothetical protein
MVYQVAAGNVNLVNLCVDQEYLETFIIFSGVALSIQEGKQGHKDTNFLAADQLINDYERVGSVPYKI